MFTLSIVTQEKILLEKEVTSVIAPGSEGYLGILTDHAPLITALKAGKLTIKEEGDIENEYFISGGFLEVSNNMVTMLVDEVEAKEE